MTEFKYNCAITRSTAHFVRQASLLKKNNRTHKQACLPCVASLEEGYDTISVGATKYAHSTHSGGFADCFFQVICKIECDYEIEPMGQSLIDYGYPYYYKYVAFSELNYDIIFEKNKLYDVKDCDRYDELVGDFEECDAIVDVDSDLDSE